MKWLALVIVLIIGLVCFQRYESAQADQRTENIRAGFSQINADDAAQTAELKRKNEQLEREIKSLEPHHHK